MAAPERQSEPAAISTPLSLLWQTDGTDAQTQTPVCADGIVYYAAGKVLHAARGSDGASLWTYEGESDFASSPALGDGSLYIEDGAGIARIDIKDGSLIWRKPVGTPIHSTPVAAGGKLYFGADDGQIYAMDLVSGDVAWTFKADSPITAPAAVCDNGDLLAVSRGNSLYCIDGATGRRKWRASLPVALTAPVYSSGVCYIGAGSDLYGIDPTNGAVRLKVHLDAGITSAPAVSEAGIFITTDDHRCTALSARGSRIWTADIGENSAAPVLTAGKTVVISTQHGVIFACDSRTGKLLWNYVMEPKASAERPRASVFASPIYAASTLYVQSSRCLSAFQAQAADKDSPVVADMIPSGATAVSGARIPFAATVSDQGSGISPSTVVLTVDGAAFDSVHYFAGWNGVRVSADGDAAALKPLADGVHTATLKAADWKGNTVTRTWNFTVDSKVTALPSNAPASRPAPSSGAYSSDPWADTNYPYPRPSPDGDNRLQRQQALQIYQTLMREYQQNGGSLPPLPPSY